MEYHNGTSESLIVSATSVTVGIKGDNVEMCRNCKVLRDDDDNLIVDVIPRLNAKYTARIPDDAIVSQAEDGEIAIFIEPTEEAAIIIRRLWKDQERLIRESN